MKIDVGPITSGVPFVPAGIPYIYMALSGLLLKIWHCTDANSLLMQISGDNIGAIPQELSITQEILSLHQITRVRTTDSTLPYYDAGLHSHRSSVLHQRP